MSIVCIQEINFDENKISKLFGILSELTTSPILSKDKLLEIINKLPDNHFIYVYVNVHGVPVGTVSLLIEQKLIRDGKKVGHIEDLVVDKNYFGQGVASKLINRCKETARKHDCYKIILDCKEEIAEFYENQNFVKQGLCMRFDVT
jgi:glucosamine-phosphate N-acetyltransferase